MPSAFEYIPPTDTKRSTFNNALSTEKSKRRTAYRTALKYYAGNQPDQLEFNEDEPDDNTVINLVKMTADRTVSFLFPAIPDFVTDEDKVEKNDEEKYILEAIEANGGLNLLTKIGLRGFLSGHNFVRVKAVPEALRGRDDVYESIISLDPLSISVFWKADDVSDVVWYEYRFISGNEVYIQDYVNNRNGSWTIYTYKTVGETNSIFNETPTAHGQGGVVSIDLVDFRTSTFTLVMTEEHTSLIPPIVEFPHLPDPDNYLGLNEVTQNDLQDTINRIASERNRIVRENSDPIDVLIGSDADEIAGDGGFYSIANAGAKIQRLEMRGDLSGISDTLDRLVETYLSIARVVLLKGDAKDLQRVTNASVRTLFLDSIAKNSVLRQNYGMGLALIAKLVILMAFERGRLGDNPVNRKVSTKFPEPLPRDETEIANVNAVGTSNGWMSNRTAATRMGLDWATEKAQIDLQNEEALDQQRQQMELMQEFQPDESESDDSNFDD